MTDNSLAPPFYTGGRLDLGQERRRMLASRTISMVLVILIHIFFFFFFAISILNLNNQGRRMVETILLLPTAGNDRMARERLITPEVKPRQAPLASTAPITIPRLPVPVPENQPRGGTATPGDILGAVGQALACAAGNFEHLTQPERERCRRIPWQGARLPSGNIVLLPEPGQPRLAGAPQPEFRVSGSDQIQRNLNAGGPPCPILQNTPCLSDILPGGGGRAGALNSHVGR